MIVHVSNRRIRQAQAAEEERRRIYREVWGEDAPRQLADSLPDEAKKLLHALQAIQ